MEDRGGAPAVAHNASPAGVRDESVVPVPPRVRSDLNRGRNAPRRGRALPPDVRGPATRRLRTATRAMERPGAPERVPSAARLPRPITLNCDASGVRQNAAERCGRRSAEVLYQHEILADRHRPAKQKHLPVGGHSEGDAGWAVEVTHNPIAARSQLVKPERILSGPAESSVIEVIDTVLEHGKSPVGHVFQHAPFLAAIDGLGEERAD